MTVTVAEAKNKLYELPEAVETRTRHTIQNHGNPFATIVRAEDAPPRQPRFGTLGKLSDIVIDPQCMKT